MNIFYLSKPFIFRYFKELVFNYLKKKKKKGEEGDWGWFCEEGDWIGILDNRIEYNNTTRHEWRAKQNDCQFVFRSFVELH